MKIGYICIGNSCRSQIAEGFTKEQGRTKVEAFSAGTRPAERVNPQAIQVMHEIGLDISDHRPKLLEDIPDLDILVTMGCGVECPFKPAKYRVDWQIKDPVGEDLDFFRKIREEIRGKVEHLLKEIEDGEYV